MSKNCGWFLLTALSLLLLAGPGQAEIQEKPLFVNSPVLGDFSQAQKIQEKKTASLKVWPTFLEYAAKAGPAARGRLPKGQEALEVAYDEVWVAQGQGYQAFGQKQVHNGQPDRASLYWRDGLLQAYTLERYYTGDPLSYERLDQPGYRVVLILDRQELQPEIAKLGAQAEAFHNMTPRDHLLEARRALLEGMPNDKDIKKRTYGRLGDARQHLEAIPKKAKEEYGEAQKLLKEVDRREEDAKKYRQVMRQAEEEQALKKRQELVKEMDRDFLDKGMDVKMELSGPDKDRLSLDCLLFSRPMVFALVDKTEILKNLKQAGFKEVTFANKAISYSWEIGLENL